MTDENRKIATKNLLSPILAEIRIELVDIEIQRSKRSKVMRLLIHKSDGITASDCGQVSKIAQPILSVNGITTELWRLEVASPGIKRPLKTSSDFKRNLGREIKVKLDPNDKAMVGVVQNVESEEVTIAVNGNEIRELKLSEIVSARVALKW